MEASVRIDLGQRSRAITVGRLLNRTRHESRYETEKGSLVAVAEMSFRRCHTYWELTS